MSSSLTQVPPISKHWPALIAAAFGWPAFLFTCLVAVIPARALALPQPAAAGTEQASMPQREALGISLNMQEADIRAVVHWLSATTGKAFAIDPRVKGQLSVHAPAPLSVDQAYRVVIEALQVHGFAAIDSGAVVRIVPDSLAKSQPADFTELIEGTDPALRTHVLALSQVPAAELVRQLKPLIPPAGHISALAEDRLLLIDSLPNIRRLGRLAEHIDQSGAMTFEVFPLQHTSAAAARELLAAFGDDGRAKRNIAVDQRTNSLLLSGNPSQRRQWRQLLQSVDRPQQRGAATRVFYLHYLNATDLLPVLRSLAASEPPPGSAGETSIDALASANAIIANGPEAFLDDIGSVIQQTDLRRAQVLVDAIIVEVSDDFAREIGVQWKSSLSDGVIAATRFDGGVAEASKMLLGQGLSLGFLQNSDLRFLLNAIATQVDANILSQPSVVTLDNEAAEILVGQNIPLITGQSTSAATPNDNPFTTVERKDIGISLKVTPQINGGREITLDVVQEVENISPTATSEAQDVVTTKRSIKTKVLVTDQDILVLGGLIDDADQETVKKVPLLGDIPLLGALFRNKKVEKLRRNLMVFIRPTILNGGTKSQHLSQSRYEHMRELQQRDARGGSAERRQVLLPEYQTFSPAP